MDSYGTNVETTQPKTVSYASGKIFLQVFALNPIPIFIGVAVIVALVSLVVIILPAIDSTVVMDKPPVDPAVSKAIEGKVWGAGVSAYIIPVAVILLIVGGVYIWGMHDK